MATANAGTAAAAAAGTSAVSSSAALSPQQLPPAPATSTPNGGGHPSTIATTSSAQLAPAIATTFSGSKVPFALTVEQVSKFLTFKKPEDSVAFLASHAGLQEYLTDQKSAILLELYHYALTFCKEQTFTPIKAAVFLAIVKETHEKATATPMAQLEQDFGYFKELVLRHCIHRPPQSERLFEMAEAQKITDYMTETYFRHYSLYKYVFGQSSTANPGNEATNEALASDTTKNAKTTAARPAKSAGKSPTKPGNSSGGSSTSNAAKVNSDESKK